MPVEDLGHSGTTWCMYQCWKLFEHYVDSDLWPRKVDVCQFLFNQLLSHTAPPPHQILQREFLQFCWCSCTELGWSIQPHCWEGGIAINLHFIGRIGNRRARTPFIYGVTGETGQTDDTKEWQWGGERASGDKGKSKTQKKLVAIGEKERERKSVGNKTWGVLVEGEMMRRKNKTAKKLIKDAAKKEYVKNEG